MVMKQIFDKSRTLVYREPIDTNNIQKTIINFVSGRNYLARDKTDTMLIVNNDLPSKNRAYRFIGFLPKRIMSVSMNYFKIESKDIFSTKLYVLVYLHQNNERRQLLDSINIPLK